MEPYFQTSHEHHNPLAVAGAAPAPPPRRADTEPVPPQQPRLNGQKRPFPASQPEQWRLPEPVAMHRVSGLARLSRAIVLRMLAGLRHGELTVVDGDGRRTFGQAGPGAPRATLWVRDPGMYARVLAGGTIGAGESYMAGAWDTDDLTALVRLFVANRNVMGRMDRRFTAVANAFHKAWHALRRNTRRGSRRNIAEHYDLGNEFFALMLDPTMMYSGAFFSDAQTTLEAAQLAKLDRICAKLALGPRDHVLEIGTGWGGFAVRAAQTYGCRVTTTTISRQQYDFARQRVREAGLDGLVTVLLKDYRDLTGVYDKLVSIEMIEAVGHSYYPSFFRQCARLLKPGGKMLLQSITIDDRHYEEARRSVDFIQRYIFPGGSLPSVGVLNDTAVRHTDLRLEHFEDIGPHYAETLAHWRSNFARQEERIAALGYDERFRRMWRFYLSYCEGGFRERSIGNAQMVFTRPDCRHTPAHPPSA